MVDGTPETLVLDLEDAAHLRLLERAYDEILVPSFTPDELLSLASIRGLAGTAQDVTLRIQGDDLLAVLVTDPFGPEAISLVSYLAVRPGLRGGGHGGALLGHAASRWAAAGAALVLGEVHDPRCFPEREGEQPLARLRFYERQGCELLGAPWVQPAVSEGGARVPGMLLISFHRSGSFAGERLPGGPLVAWADAYFEECEGPGAPDAERSAIRDRLGDPSGIAILPIGDYASVPLLRA